MKSRTAVLFMMALLLGLTGCVAPPLSQPADVPAVSGAESSGPSFNFPSYFTSVEQTQNLAGVDLWVGGVGVVSWTDAVQVSPELAGLAGTYDFLETATVLGVLTVGTTNRTQGTVSIYPERGTLTVGSETVYFGSFPDLIGGENWAGGIKGGPLLFVLHQTTWDDIVAGIDFILEADAALDSSGKPLADESYRVVVPIKP